jgi:phosphoribosylformylglycinamidine (FGAM) synthase-like enzyme
VPDLDDPQDLVNLVNAVNALRGAGPPLAYHDRSDGGLFAAACEMAFAGHVGVSLNVDLLVTEGDGISDSRADTATPRTGPRRSAPRREELTLKALFNEELGVLLQVRTDRAQRRHAGAARARPVEVQPLRRQDPAAVVARSKSARARCRSGATPRRCSAPSCPTCTRSGTASAGRSASSATTPLCADRNTPPPAIRPTPACTFN